MRITKASKDKPLSREQLLEITQEIYGPGSRWYSDLALDLSGIRGTPTLISSAAVQQWMNADDRRPPGWATALVYQLLSVKRAEFMLRAARLQSWIDLVETSHLYPGASAADAPQNGL